MRTADASVTAHPTRAQPRLVWAGAHLPQGSKLRGMRGVCLLIAAGVVLALSGSAGATPFRHHNSTAEEAFHVFEGHVFAKLRPMLAGAPQGEGECRPAKHHARAHFRCGLTLYGGGLPATCKVAALLAQTRHGFRFDWLRESRFCRPRPATPVPRTQSK
jgi:hypothetical protein